MPITLSDNFEVGLPTWVASNGAAARTFIGASAHSGQWAGLLQYDGTGVPTLNHPLTLRTGDLITVRLWLIDVTTAGDVEVYLDAGDGNLVLRATASPLTPSAWKLVEFSVTALGTTGALELRYLGTTLRWYVDDVEVRSSLAKTNDLYEALKADLDTVTDLVVYDEPTEPDSVTTPAAIIRNVEGGGSSEEGAMFTSGSGGGGTEANQTFEVKLVTRSATPHASIQDLMDAVRNAVEVTTSNINTEAGVLWSVFTSWDEMMTSGDIANLRAEITMSLSVRYNYRFGAL